MQDSLQTEYKFTLSVTNRDLQGGTIPTLEVRIESDVPTRTTDKLVRMLVRRPEVEKWLRDELTDLSVNPNCIWQPFPASLRWIRATPIHGTPFMLVQLFGAKDAHDAANLAGRLKIKVY